MASALFFITPLLCEVLNRIPKLFKYAILMSFAYAGVWAQHKGYKLLHREYDLIGFYSAGMVGHDIFIDFYNWIPSNPVAQIASVGILFVTPWSELPEKPLPYITLCTIPVLIFFLVQLKAGKACMFNRVFNIKVFPKIAKLSFISYCL